MSARADREEERDQIEIMASMKLSFTFILLLSGLVVLGEIGGTEAACPARCVQAAYLTCDNYPSKQIGGCDCQCAPKDGKNCALHFLSTGRTLNCPAQ